MLMRFKHEGRDVTLQGIMNKVIGEQEHGRVIRKKPTGAIVQLLAFENYNVPMLEGSDEKELQPLLEEFTEIFQELTGLPPSSSLDHHIPLQSDNRPVCYKPYRYPHYHKLEIEKPVVEMLTTSVVRPSNSPLSSPVILVKKQDGSWRMCVDCKSLNQLTIKDKFPILVIDE